MKISSLPPDLNPSSSQLSCKHSRAENRLIVQKFAVLAEWKWRFQKSVGYVSLILVAFCFLNFSGRQQGPQQVRGSVSCPLCFRI